MLDEDAEDAERFKSEGGVRLGSAGRVKWSGREKRLLLLLLLLAKAEEEASAMGAKAGIGVKYEAGDEAYERD